MQPAPIPAEWLLEGAPQTQAALLGRSRDGTVETYVWETTAGRFRWIFSHDETVTVVEGELFVCDENDVEHRLIPGDVAYFPAGAVSLWRIPEKVRKIAALRQNIPLPARLVMKFCNKLEAFLKGRSSPPSGF